MWSMAPSWFANDANWGTLLRLYAGADGILGLQRKGFTKRRRFMKRM